MTDQPINSFAMNRLDFRLPDFTRFSWTDDAAKAEWEPKIQRIVSCRRELEWLSVVHSIRRCCLFSVSPDELTDLASDLIRHELIALPIAKLRVSNHPYATIGEEARPGDAFNYRVVIGSIQDTAAFKTAWDAKDDAAQRGLLGYPPCCSDFFEHVWTKEQFIDTTWPMAVNTTEAREKEFLCEVESMPLETNVILRWLGVRAVPHLPCGFTCQASIKSGQDFIELGRSSGFESEMGWLSEILSWPAEWSALHGIAEIKTPVVKIATCTDATDDKYTIRYHGSEYPAKGATGLSFPYQQPQPLIAS